MEPAVVKVLSTDMDKIKGISWAESMWETLENCSKLAFLNWVDIVLTMSQNEEDVIEWKSIFIEQFQERCDDLVLDIKELHEQVIVNIEKHLNRVEALCKILQIEMPVMGQQKLGLYQEQFKLKQKIKELEQILEARQSEFNQLREKLLELSNSLGKAPQLFNDNFLPSQNEILDFQKHIEQLEQEKFNRLEKFTSIKDELVQIIEELKYMPVNTFENDIINGDDTQFLITDENMKALNEFYLKLKNELNDVKEEVVQLKNKIETLWNILDVDFVEREEFHQKIIGTSHDTLKTLETLRLELKRCETLKRINIKVFIDRLREELLQLWDNCRCSESVRNEFRFFESDTYTEDLLELHEVQLKKWQIFYEENKELLSLLNKHETLWTKMRQLEQNATCPDRYNNRGGKLLKEERERNLLAKQIPKIESSLMYLADRYQNKHGVPFLSCGMTIETYISNLHADRENEKKLKLSARKLQKESTIMTPLPSTSAMTSKRCLMEGPSERQTPRKTPRKVLTGSSKRKLCPLQIPKIQVTTINRSKRLSTERKKRIEKIRRLSRQKEFRENSTYLDFENDLSNRVDLRSTMNAVAGSSKDDSTVVTKALLTPSTVCNVKTPVKISTKSPKSSAKSPNFPSKLTTAKSNIKLIF